MKNKKLMIIFICIAVIIGVLLFYFFSHKGGTPYPTGTAYPTNTLPIFTYSPIASPTDDKVNLMTTKGEVTVNNFYKTAKNGGGGALIIKDTPEYYMGYSTKDNSFNLVVNQQPVQIIRARLERAFLDTLGINQDDACKLTVVLAVPFDVDEQLAGKDYHLSFCPNGVAF